ncbi:uncharacterized protein [Venturia canescens]|uniref:uncharacterized protein n=1 Tax=Venturia canescens TaxID=32260 RepID=UPI001C9C5662|nr:uncharacterized protein LOC122417742 [Venturia canescens]
MKSYLLIALFIVGLQISTDGIVKAQQQYTCPHSNPPIVCPHSDVHNCIAYCSSKVPKKPELVGDAGFPCLNTHPRLMCPSSSTAYCQTFCASAERAQLYRFKMEGLKGRFTPRLDQPRDLLR